MVSRKSAFVKTKYPPLKQSKKAKGKMTKIGVQPYIEGMDVEEARKTLRKMRLSQETKKARKRR